jgi:hypothetical protein
MCGWIARWARGKGGDERERKDGRKQASQPGSEEGMQRDDGAL